MNDNQTVTPYSFTLVFRVGGLVDSSLSPEDTQAQLREELRLFYGEDGYELLDFREATQDEVETYRKYLQDEAEETNQTIN